MATKSGLDIFQSCNVLAFNWVKNIELESVIAVWAPIFALKITHTQLEMQCIYVTTVFGYEEPAFTILFTQVFTELVMKTGV